MPGRLRGQSVFVLAMSSSLCCPSLLAASLEPQAEFDIETLKHRNIDPKVAEYFRDAPRFAEGVHLVELLINGSSKGQIKARFDTKGQLCVTSDLMDRAGLISDLSAQNVDEACPSFSRLFPQGEAQLRPDKAQVSLVVPLESVKPDESQKRQAVGGGTAGLFNYDVLVNKQEFSGTSSDYRSLGSELGMNLGGWALRSRQVYTDIDGQTDQEHLYAYGATTLERYDAELQVGELNMSSPLFAGTAFTGVQMQPERSMGAQKGNGARVEGIAHSSARVEVRQNGALIYSTLVPPGPFTLTDLPLLSSNIDLDVQIHEDNGDERRFTVPAATLKGASLDTVAGYSVSVGKVREIGDSQSKTPSFAAITFDPWATPENRLTAGSIIGEDYLSAGWAFDHVLTQNTTISVQQIVSDAQDEGVKGVQTELRLNSRLSEMMSASLTATEQTEDFRTLSDTTFIDEDSDEDDFRDKGSYTASLNYSHGELGAFGTFYTRSTSYGGDPSARAGVSWSRMFERANVSLTMEHETESSGDDSIGDAMYLSVSIPIGQSARLRTYARNDDRSGTRAGAQYSDTLSDTANYSVTAERDDEQQSDVSGRLNLLPRYTQVGLGYSQRDSGDGSSYDASLSGGVAVHSNGITFSPYPIEDTFGIVTVGDVAGVKLETPQGPVWTDAMGQAVVPDLPAYRVSRLEVDTSTLPRNVDIANGFQQVEAARASVQHLDFDVVTVRRVLLTATGPDGALLSKGLTVLDHNGQYVTTVLADGAVFLSQNGEPLGRYTVVLSDEQQCVLSFELPETADVEAFYEKVNATCAMPEKRNASPAGATSQ